MSHKDDPATSGPTHLIHKIAKHLKRKMTWLRSGPLVLLLLKDAATLFYFYHLEKSPLHIIKENGENVS